MSENVYQVTNPKPSYLREVLLANAVFSEVSGALMLLVPGRIADWTGIPSPLAIAIIGAVLILYGFDIWYFCRGEKHLRTVGIIAVIGDTAWVAATIIILASGLLPLTSVGKWVVAVIADIVGLFAILQIVMLRRLASAR